MRFRFEVDGRVHAVDVERTGGPWAVSLGGRRWWAQMHPSGQGWSLLLSAADADDDQVVSPRFSKLNGTTCPPWRSSSSRLSTAPSIR